MPSPHGSLLSFRLLLNMIIRLFNSNFEYIVVVAVVVAVVVIIVSDKVPQPRSDNVFRQALTRVIQHSDVVVVVV